MHMHTVQFEKTQPMFQSHNSIKTQCRGIPEIFPLSNKTEVDDQTTDFLSS